MQDFLPIDLFWPEHRKTLRLEKRVGAGRASNIIYLWIWAAKNRRDGNLSGLDNEDIENICRWNSGSKGAFAIALRDVGFIDGDEGAYTLHDWHGWQSYFCDIERRAKAAQRQRKRRSVTRRDIRVTCHTESVTPLRGDLDLEREEIRSKIKTPSSPQPRKPRVDAPAPSGFDAFWQAYPRKVGKQAAMKSYASALKRGVKDRILLDAVMAQRLWPPGHGLNKDPDPGNPHPTTWLNQGRWDDEPPVNTTNIRELKFDQSGNLLP